MRYWISDERGVGLRYVEAESPDEALLAFLFMKAHAQHEIGTKWLSDAVLLPTGPHFKARRVRMPEGGWFQAEPVEDEAA